MDGLLETPSVIRRLMGRSLQKLLMCLIYLRVKQNPNIGDHVIYYSLIILHYFEEKFKEKNCNILRRLIVYLLVNNNSVGNLQFLFNY